MKFKATALAVADLDFASVCNYGALHYRQPQTCTSGFARASAVDAVETVEQMGQMLLAYAYAVVEENKVIEIFWFLRQGFSV